MGLADDIPTSIITGSPAQTRLTPLPPPPYGTPSPSLPLGLPPPPYEATESARSPAQIPATRIDSLATTAGTTTESLSTSCSSRSSSVSDSLSDDDSDSDNSLSDSSSCSCNCSQCERGAELDGAADALFSFSSHSAPGSEIPGDILPHLCAGCHALVQERLQESGAGTGTGTGAQTAGSGSLRNGVLHCRKRYKKLKKVLKKCKRKCRRKRRQTNSTNENHAAETSAPSTAAPVTQTSERETVA